MSSSIYDTSTQHPIATRQDPFWSWLPVAALWVVFIGIVYAVYEIDPAGFGLSAYKVYHESAHALLQGYPIYQGTIGWIYLYPPLLAQLLMPVVEFLSYDEAALVWLLLNMVILIGTLTMLVNYIPAKWAKMLWVGAVFFFPIGQALYIGQVTIIMLALLAFAWVAVQEDKPRLAGVLLATAAWIKVFPGVLVLYFLWKRDWEVIRGVALAGIILLLFQVAVSGPEMMLAFFGTLFELTANGQPDVNFENNSIMAFASRLFQPNPNVQPLVISPLLYSFTRISLTVLVIGGAVYTILRSTGRSLSKDLSWRFDLEYSLIIVTILLFGATLWISGMPPLLLIYVLILRNLGIYTRPKQIIVWLLLSYVFITTFTPIMLALIDHGMHSVVLSTGFLGVFIVWGVLFALLNRSRKMIL